MEIEPMAARKPDIRILLTNDEAEILLNMVIEGKAYAADCNENTDSHEEFILQLSRALNE